MMRDRLFLAVSLMVSLMGVWAARPVEAAAPQKETKDVPLEVTADQSLEWYQDKSLYIARGKAKAVKGETVIEADLLTAHKRVEPRKKPVEGHEAKEDGGSDGMGGDIDLLTAEGNVHISDPRQQIFGDHGVYDTDRKYMKVTGKALRYQTPFEVVTAKDYLVYDEKNNKAVAVGKAVAVHQKTVDDRRQIEADVLTAVFSEPSAGPREMTKMLADGNVTIVTKTDISRGDHAVYDLKQNNAILTGHVRITHGSTQMAGDKGETDFAAGQSRLLTETNKRVKVVVPPKDVPATAPKVEKGDKEVGQ